MKVKFLRDLLDRGWVEEDIIQSSIGGCAEPNDFQFVSLTKDLQDLIDRIGLEYSLELEENFIIEGGGWEDIDFSIYLYLEGTEDQIALFKISSQFNLGEMKIIEF